MAIVVRMPRERITQRELEVLEAVLEMGPRHLRRVRNVEEEWLGKLRRGATVEPGELGLEECEEWAVVRRLKVVRKRGRR